MTGRAYYNEVDPYMAQWLRNLIAAGQIAPGIVDERSIEDVRPDELAEFTQCHFFAGLGAWSYALRLAGWPDDRPVWTGSCPCQPFSTAGKGAGFADERHVWPFFLHLIRVRRPAVVLGEQVASKDADAWIDLVQADLEAVGYAVGAVPFPSAGVGAPHIRDRTYWVADAESQRLQGQPLREIGGRSALGAAHIGVLSGLADGDSAGCSSRGEGCAPVGYRPPAEPDRGVGGLDNANNKGLEGFGRGHQAPRGRIGAIRPTAEAGESGGMADADGRNTGTEREQRSGEQRQLPQDSGCGDISAAAGPTNGFWRTADWLFCRDGKWRPVEASHVKMVDGPATSVGRVRASRDSDASQKGEVNGATLRTLPGAAGDKDLSEVEGMRSQFPEPEVLRQGVHGSGIRRADQSAEREEQPAAIREAGGAGMRAMWEVEEPASPSCGREPDEQRSVELEDVVRLLSPSLSLAQLHGDGRTAEALRALQCAIHEEGLVLHTPVSIQAIWASLGEEAKNRIGMGFDASRWEKLAPFPLIAGSPAKRSGADWRSPAGKEGFGHRVSRLRGYGNAINAQAARVFIEAVMSDREPA